MTIDATTDQALREQIAQAVGPLLHALTCQRIEDHPWEFCSMWPAPAVSAFSDAVLPVVQAHEKALHDRWAYALDKWRNQLKATDSMMAERDAARSDLSSLRDAVARLADQLDAEADEVGAIGHPPHSAANRRGATDGLRDSARRLRSLLPQEGQE